MIQQSNGRRQESLEEISTDVLVVGSEGAGARAAISAVEITPRVILASKGLFGGSGATLTAVYSCCAAFGYADPRDNPHEHFVDTVRGGLYLNNQKLVEVFTKEAPRRIVELDGYGAKFERTPDGRYAQDIMPGHTYARALHYKTQTGFEFRRGLMREVKRRGIDVRQDFMILDVLVSGGRVAGALALDIAGGRLVLIRCPTVIIATGGGTELYFPHTDTSSDLTGDGFAMALRAGADLVDMEFMQFFPTALIWPPALNGTIAIAMMRYRCNGHLLNKHGERFMYKYDPVHGDQANRDITSRGIVMEVMDGRGSPHGGAYLDISYLPRNLVQEFINEYFPNFSVKGYNLLEAGIDPRVDAVEVAPASHYSMGGVRINERAAGTVPGLFAAGEASAGVHGANRIEGNGLPETQVTGAIAGENAARYSQEMDAASVDAAEVQRLVEAYQTPLRRDEGQQHFDFRRRLQRIMWEQVGLVRSGAGLRKALAEFEALAEEYRAELVVRNTRGSFNREWADAVETGNMLLVGRAMAQAALAREETRGSHFRTDCPNEKDPSWLVNHVVTLCDGQLRVERSPLVITKLDPFADLAITGAQPAAVAGPGAEELL